MLPTFPFNVNMNEEAEIPSVSVVPDESNSGVETGMSIDDSNQCSSTSQLKSDDTENTYNTFELNSQVSSIDLSGNVKTIKDIMPEKDKIKNVMLDRVAASDAHFISQQRNDPDLTLTEKRDIASDVLDMSCVTFMHRFGQYLKVVDLQYFRELEGNYEIDFFVHDIFKRNNVTYSKTRVKNRRYQAMQKLTSDGEYFGENEMKWRDPYLYEQMVGLHLSGEEIDAKIDKTDLRFSKILIQHLDQQNENELYKYLKDKEGGQMEEEEESDDEEKKMDQDDDESENPKTEKLGAEEKQELKDEFLQIMQERFLSGQDKGFDYRQVDNNPDYDTFDILEKDAEEKYFDEEDPVDL